MLLTLIPMFTPMLVMADKVNQTEGYHNPVQERSGSAASWRASNVIGQDVKNAGSETIGEVKDIVVDMKSGEIVAVIISTGGFLGIGEALSAVPVALLRYDSRAEGFKTKLTKEQLGRAPQFKAKQWPDYSEANSTEALRSFLKSLDGNVDPWDDTVMSQGNNEKDLKITKNIRSEIMDTDLSANAKNIKVITLGERVTLNGVVDSKAEHSKILKIAGTHCLKSLITDNLTVKSQ